MKLEGCQVTHRSRSSCTKRKRSQGDWWWRKTHRWAQSMHVLKSRSSFWHSASQVCWNSFCILSRLASHIASAASCCAWSCAWKSAYIWAYNIWLHGKNTKQTYVKIKEWRINRNMLQCRHLDLCSVWPWAYGRAWAGAPSLNLQESWSIGCVDCSIANPESAMLLASSHPHDDFSINELRAWVKLPCHWVVLTKAVVDGRVVVHFGRVLRVLQLQHTANTCSTWQTLTAGSNGVSVSMFAMCLGLGSQQTGQFVMCLVFTMCVLGCVTRLISLLPWVLFLPCASLAAHGNLAVSRIDVANESLFALPLICLEMHSSWSGECTLNMITF